jgi:heavy metal sensor kinase
MTSPLHSIRWRVQLWHALILLIAIGALCAAVFRFQWESELRRIDRELNGKKREVLFGLGTANAGRPAPPEEMLEKLSRGEVSLPAVITSGYQGNAPGYAYFSFRDRAGRVLLQSPNAPADVLVLAVPAAGFIEESRTIFRRRESSSAADFGLRVIIGRDIDPELDQRQRFAWSLAAAGFGVWLIGLLGGWWLAGRAIRPIQSISRTATRIAEGNLDERITVEQGAGELRELGAVLNRTFDRLRHALELQRQFTADAAHELRTPITILAAETQRILKRERSPEEYRTAFETCSETTARMRRLVEDLLLLARQESTSVPHETCDLGEIAGDVAQQLTPLATAKQLQLHTNLDPALCSGQRSALSTVIANLIGNAIQHHDRADGHIHIFTRQNDGSAIFTVRDDGPGIAPEDLRHIFDRFYRADKARTVTGSQHTGLGLAIAKTVIESHGGQIECQSTPATGATFTITLPR